MNWDLDLPSPVGEGVTRESDFRFLFNVARVTDEESPSEETTHPSARRCLNKNVYARCSQPPSLAREGFRKSKFAYDKDFQMCQQIKI